MYFINDYNMYLIGGASTVSVVDLSTVSSSVPVINKPVTSTTSGKHTLNTTLIN